MGTIPTTPQSGLVISLTRCCNLQVRYLLRMSSVYPYKVCIKRTISQVSPCIRPKDVSFKAPPPGSLLPLCGMGARKISSRGRYIGTTYACIRRTECLLLLCK